MSEEAQAVFDENILGVLATTNEDGTPWASALHVLTDGRAVYWFSKETTEHSQNIARDGRVSLSLFSPDESRGPKGVYVNGRAEKLSGDDDQQARDVFVKRLGSLPAAFETATVYRLPIGTYSEQKSTGKCWYFYS